MRMIALLSVTFLTHTILTLLSATYPIHLKQPKSFLLQHRAHRRRHHSGRPWLRLYVYSLCRRPHQLCGATSGCDKMSVDIGE